MFTRLEDRPLHSQMFAATVEDAWWACEQPERRPDASAQFDLRCKPCALASWAMICDEDLHRLGLTTDVMSGAQVLTFTDARSITLAALRTLHAFDPVPDEVSS